MQQTVNSYAAASARLSLREIAYGELAGAREPRLNPLQGMPCTQCKVLYVGKYSNPCFGPLGEHLTRHARGAEIQPSGPPKHPQFLPRGPLG